MKKITKKEMTDAELEIIGRQLSEAVKALSIAWDRGMKVMPLKSIEYNAICAAGKKAQRAYNTVRDMAKYERKWSTTKLTEVFDVGCGYGFN